MGVGLVPFYEPPSRDDALYNGDGKGLAEEFDRLNEIAAAAALRPLSDFAGQYGEDEEPSELRYHPINEGLVTVEGLIKVIQSSPHIAASLSDCKYTLEELDELARSLRAAAAEGANFCLVFM